MRQTDGNETHTAQHTAQQKIGRPRQTAETGGSADLQQNAESQTGFRQGQTLVCYTVCVVVSPVWAHDSEAPWAMVVPEAWHRFRGQTRQGGWHMHLSSTRYRAADPE